MFDFLIIILKQTLLYFPLILGAFIGISLMKVPILSIEAAYVCAPAIVMNVFKFVGPLTNYTMFFCILLSSLLGGIVIGLIFSFIVIFCRIPYLLASILVLGIFHGLNQLILGAASISFNQISDMLTFFDLSFLSKELPFLVVLFVVLFIVSFWFLKTQLGVSLAVFGDNPNFFEHYKISKNYIFTCGMIISHLLVGLAGSCIAQSNGFVDITMGNGIILLSITSIILGKTFLSISMHKSVLVPFFGAVIYFSIQQILLLVGFDLKYFTMVQSFIVLIAIYNAYKVRSMRELNFDSDTLGV